MLLLFFGLIFLLLLMKALIVPLRQSPHCVLNFWKGQGTLNSTYLMLQHKVKTKFRKMSKPISNNQVSIFAIDSDGYPQVLWCFCNALCPITLPLQFTTCLDQGLNLAKLCPVPTEVRSSMETEANLFSHGLSEPWTESDRFLLPTSHPLQIKWLKCISE